MKSLPRFLFKLKKNLHQSLLILALLLSSFTFADSAKEYLYVEIRGLSQQRGVPELKKELSTITEISSFEYCDKAGLLILGTNDSIDSLRSNVNRLLHRLNYHYIIKSSISIEDAKNICNRHQ